MTFTVKFWGVRGSLACPGPQFVKYGGNTSCIEINLGERRILLDGGTGLRNAARNFMDDPSREIYLLFTHTHWDHINGFPFFLPAYNPDWTVHVKAGHMKHTGGVRSVLSSQMATPMFPIPIEALKANLTFEDFEAGEDFELYPGVHVRTAPLNHPNGATAYRIEHEGRACVYVTDTEHVPGKPDRNILGVIEGADLVIYDSTYTESEWPEKIGWGHSTWNEGMRLCRAAGVKRLAIFHHDPDHDDAFMDALEAEAAAAWAGNLVAREGMVLDIA